MSRQDGFNNVFNWIFNIIVSLFIICFTLLPQSAIFFLSLGKKKSQFTQNSLHHSRVTAPVCSKHCYTLRHQLHIWQSESSAPAGQVCGRVTSFHVNICWAAGGWRWLDAAAGRRLVRQINIHGLINTHPTWLPSSLTQHQSGASECVCLDNNQHQPQHIP